MLFLDQNTTTLGLKQNPRNVLQLQTFRFHLKLPTLVRINGSDRGWIAICDHVLIFLDWTLKGAVMWKKVPPPVVISPRLTDVPPLQPL